MNNPFGLPDELFGAILASAITEGMNTASSRSMKKIYDSYVKAGFNEVQAFELLKLVLSK